ncbi:hypothetical protein GGX14DRAFT_604124 [Mycena pura]|uniref:Uncharacterized protein n=1 Tax=Mycena pura TaxID=153505 RepID=A0AAD6UMB3_9AGAR|nr:hypothetical protein GGX14DRAFT_604124 [Mycena pura]
MPTKSVGTSDSPVLGICFVCRQCDPQPPRPRSPAPTSITVTVSKLIAPHATPAPSTTHYPLSHTARFPLPVFRRRPLPTAPARSSRCPTPRHLLMPTSSGCAQDPRPPPAARCSPPAASCPSSPARCPPPATAHRLPLPASTPGATHYPPHPPASRTHRERPAARCLSNATLRFAQDLRLQTAARRP